MVREGKKNIPVMYGAIPLDFALELMTCIYHLRNATFRELLGGGFFFPLPPSVRVEQSQTTAVGKYRGHTSTCRLLIAAVAVGGDAV